MSELEAGVRQLEQTADADAALALARHLLVLTDAPAADAKEAAWASNSLGKFFSDRSYNADARRACERALALLPGDAASDADLRASIHNTLGQLDERAGDVPGAARHLESALALLRGAQGNPVQLAFIADNLGAVLVRQGRFDRAELLFDEALRTLERAGPQRRADVATVLGNLGILFEKRGERARAKATLLRAIDTHLRAHSLEAGDARIPLVNLIGLYMKEGDEALADEFIDLLLRVGGARTGAAQQPTAIALLELGHAAFGRFQLGLAERIATRALNLLETSAGKDAAPTQQARHLLANVHNAKGNTASAERGLAQTLAAPDLTPKDHAARLIDYAKTVHARGRGSAATAIGLFEHALRLLHQTVPLDLPLLASALGNLALVHYGIDNAPRAMALYDEALALGNARALGGELAWLLYSRALLHYHLARHDQARAGMKRAIGLWSRTLGARHPFVATGYENLALVEWSSGHHAAAQRHFARATRMQADSLQRLLLVGSEAERSEAAKDQLGDLYKRISFCFATGARGAAARDAAQLLLQRKGAVLEAMARTHARSREPPDTATRERLARLEALQSRLANAAISEQLFASRDDAQSCAELETEAARLQSELSHASALGLGAPGAATLEQVRAALPPKATLIEYTRWSVFDPARSGHGIPWRGRRYAAMVLRARGEPRWFDLGEADFIDAAADSLRGLLRDADSDSEAIALACVHLHAMLLGPIEALLRGTQLLLIAPDADLNLLPFAVLAAPDAPTLCARFTLCHVGSGRDLLRAANGAHDNAVQAIVDPDYGEASGELQLAPLPGTRAEGAAILALFPRATLCTGAQASVAALKATQRPAILHIATHGLFAVPGDAAVQADPMQHAGLALAGANASRPGRPLGFIAANELAALDLRGTELVVLSACDTGLGVAAHGEEFAGLRRAFSIAGAASQVISLWAVEDDAAAALMQHFYAALAAGLGRAQALQEAQAVVRRRPRFAHTSAWAAFALWGEAGPLSPGLLQAAVGPRDE